MIPGQRIEGHDELQVRASAVRRLNAEAMRAQSGAMLMADLVQHERSTFVPGRGSMAPRVAFVSERPSLADASARAPMSGAAGRVFDKLLLSIGMTRNDVYVTHLVPWYPPNDRGTLPQERDYCAPWLRRELRALGRPPVVLLGRTVSEYLLVRPYADLLEEWRYSPGILSDCLSVRHPAYAVYQESKLPLLRTQYRRVLDHPSEMSDAAF